MGGDKYTGLPGRTNRLRIKRANCINLAEIVKKPTTVNVTSI